jgi:hypothetical protein
MDNDPSVRKAAQETLQLLVEKRTELVDVAFAAAVTRIAATDAAASIRQVAQKTLQLLVQKRPDLASTVLTESFPISRDRFDERFVQLTNCLLTLRPA